MLLPFRLLDGLKPPMPEALRSTRLPYHSKCRMNRKTQYFFSKENTFFLLLFLIQKLFCNFAISSGKLRTDILTKHLLLFRVKPKCPGNSLE